MSAQDRELVLDVAYLALVAYTSVNLSPWCILLLFAWKFQIR